MYRDRHADRAWRPVKEPGARARIPYWPGATEGRASRRAWRRQRRQLVILLLLLGSGALGLASGDGTSDIRLFLAQASKSLPIEVLPTRRDAALVASQPAVLGTAVAPRASPPARADFDGYATVIDGDSLEIRGRQIRLDGIDAPEGRQTCNRDGFVWACGADAASALAGFIRARRIACTDNGRDRFDRVLAHCWVAGQDIGAWMVREGLAVAYTRYSSRYAAEEAFARGQRHGVWASRFENPEDWRRRNPR